MLGKFDPTQIRKTAIQLGIPTDFVKKDYFVTSAIQAITNVENDFFALTFQGGTRARASAALNARDRKSKAGFPAK